MADIKNTTELVTLISILAKAVKDAKADGKVDLNDLTLLIALLPVLGPAVEGIDKIPEELADLDIEEVTALATQVKSIVGELGGSKYEEVAIHAIKAGFEIFEIVKLLKDKGDEDADTDTPTPTE